MAAKLPEVLISPKLWHTSSKFQTANQRYSTMANSQKAYLGVSKDDRKLKMAAGTGNTYISETMKNTVKILTTNLWFKTLYRWKIVLTSEYNSDRQPEVPKWPPKPEVVISLELWQIASKFQRQRLSVVVEIARGQFLWAGRGRKPRVSRWNCRPTCHGSKDISISGFNGRNAISGCRTLSQLLRGTLFGLTIWSEIPDLPL